MPPTPIRFGDLPIGTCLQVQGTLREQVVLEMAGESPGGCGLVSTVKLIYGPREWDLPASTLLRMVVVETDRRPSPVQLENPANWLPELSVGTWVCLSDPRTPARPPVTFRLQDAMAID